MLPSTFLWSHFAFVGDNLPEKQRTMGFAMQSFFIGIGAYFASKLPLILLI
jgi:maltose/moltooligosaccharide transporter